jgi:hypothetical protein
MKVSEEMLRFSEIKWAEAFGSTESPVVLCLRKNVPIYIKVRRDSQLVYRYYHASRGLGGQNIFLRIDNFSILGPRWKADHFPFKGFHDEMIFLRLDNTSMAEIAVSGSSTVSSFPHEGFSMPRPYEVTGHNARAGAEIRKYEDIKNPTLLKVKFKRAVLIDKKGWEWASSRMTARNVSLPEAFVVSVEVSESDLYFTSTDIEALKKEVQQGRELVDYPFAHKERMPGIYRMFQAAYAHNQCKMMPKDEVEKWLPEKGLKNPYRYKSIRTAKKFVWPELDRSQGGGDRGEFNLEELDEFGDQGVYEFSFVSKGLSFILAIADWWVTITKEFPDETKLTLAKKLDASRFGGLEVGDLVYLISGSQMTDEEVASFYEYQEGLSKQKGPDKKVRPIVDSKPKKASAAGRHPGHQRS